MIGGWNLFQINAMTAQFTEVTGGSNSIFADNGWILGTLVAIITWFTIIGGIKAIGKFTSKVTPIMCSLYVISAFLVCLVNIHNLPETVSLIIREAFSPKAMTGGAFACLLWGCCCCCYLMAGIVINEKKHWNLPLSLKSHVTY